MPSPLATTEVFGPLNERTSSAYSAVLTDEFGTPILLVNLASITLTLYALDANQTIINNRNQQDILNANNVTITDAGLVWTIQPADFAILDNNLAIEPRIALFTYTWASGTRSAHHEVKFLVRNLAKVT